MFWFCTYYTQGESVACFMTGALDVQSRFARRHFYAIRCCKELSYIIHVSIILVRLARIRKSLGFCCDDSLQPQIRPQSCPTCSLLCPSGSMGRTSSQCCSCKIAKLAASLLVLALSTLVHATRLPSSEAQLPFVLSQALSAAAQHSFLQQGSPEESVATSSSLGRYRDNAIVRIDINRLDDAQVTAILQQVEVSRLCRLS